MYRKANGNERLLQQHPPTEEALRPSGNDRARSVNRKTEQTYNLGNLFRFGPGWYRCGKSSHISCTTLDPVMREVIPNGGDTSVCIVGGAGFIGSHFADALLALPSTARLTLFDNFSSGREHHL